MKTKDYLMGRIVMVSPKDFTDPLQRPGQVGTVVFVRELDEDVLTVEFDDGRRNNYRADYLQTLKPKKMILEAIFHHLGMMSEKGELKNMLLVYKLLCQGRVQESLKLAMEHDTTSLYCTSNCKWLREIKQGEREYLGRKMKRRLR